MNRSGLAVPPSAAEKSAEGNVEPLPSVRLDAEPKDGTEQAKALAEIEKLDGKVTFDENSQGNRVAREPDVSPSSPANTKVAKPSTNIQMTLKRVDITLDCKKSGEKAAQLLEEARTKVQSYDVYLRYTTRAMLDISRTKEIQYPVTEVEAGGEGRVGP